MSNYCFLRGDVMAMEREVLSALDYNISLPTRTYFLNRFLLATQVGEEDSSLSCGVDGTTEQHQQHAITERNYKEASFAYYLMDITLQNYGFNQYPMSLVAAGIVHYVKQCYRPMKEVIWTHTLVFYTGYEERHLIPVVYALQSFHSALYMSGHVSVVKKYGCQQYRYCSSELALSKTRIRFDNNAAKHRFLCQPTTNELQHMHASDDIIVRDDAGRSNMTPTSFLNLESNVQEEEEEREMSEAADDREGFVDYVEEQHIDR
jgi:hypothetical protein